MTPDDTTGAGAVKTALLVRLDAKPDKAEQLERLLSDGARLVAEEPATTAWFAVRLTHTGFAIFDAFPDEAGRQAHLTGPLAAALAARSADLLSTAPRIEPCTVLASKLPLRTT